MAPLLRKLHRRGLPTQSSLLALRPDCLHSSFHVVEGCDECLHQLPSSKWENPNLGCDEFQSGLCRTFPRWISQISCGHLGSSSRSNFLVGPQPWSTRPFARSMSIKSREDRRKIDLARREFQLLRRRTKLLKASLSPEERLLWRLRKSNRKKAVLLQRLKKYELEEDPESVHDPELITPEQLQALKKIGYKNRNYVPVGRRGVYGGVVQNMHMHWKFHETVQVDCHIFKREGIRDIARQLAVLSGGIVIDIHQATTIIMYRGRNYKQPKTEMIPPNTLTKRKALFKSKYLQALEGLEVNIKDVEAQLQMLRRNQKENAAKATEKDTNKPLQVLKDKGVDSNLLTNLDKVSSDDDDSLFSSWEFDSLDEDELSDDDDSKHKKAEGAELDRQEIAKPLNWTTEDSAPLGGKKKRLTAKELILAEQELFRNSPKRLAEAAQKSSSISSQADELSHGTVDLDDRLRTDDDTDDENSKGVKGDKKPSQPESLRADDKKLSQRTIEEDFDLESFSEEDISCNDNKAVETPEVTHKLKGHKQIMNKKIAKFVEDFTTDEDEEDEVFVTDSESEDSESEDDTGVRESKTGQLAGDAKDPRG